MEHDYFADEPESLSSYLTFRVCDFLSETAAEKGGDDLSIGLSHAKADMVNSLLIPALEDNYGEAVFDPRCFNTDKLIKVCEDTEKIVDSILNQRKSSTFVDPRYFTYGGSTVLVVLFKISVELLDEGIELQLPSRARVDAMMDKFDLYESYFADSID